MAISFPEMSGAGHMATKEDMRLLVMFNVLACLPHNAAYAGGAEL